MPIDAAQKRDEFRVDIVDALCRYFKRGETKEKNIGLELEHFVLTDKNMPLSYTDGVEKILHSASGLFDRIYTENGKLLAGENSHYSISIEPGAQLEISVKPCGTVEEIERILDEFYADFLPLVENMGCRLINKGTLGADIPDKTEMIPKRRYEFMDEYFKTSGTMGRYMMRSSASTQVSVDYENESDFVKKFRTAYLISPFLALFSASGETGADEYLKRIDIWNNVDNKRTMPPADLFAETFGYRSYARFISEAPMIFVPESEGYTFTDDKSCSEVAKRYGINEDMLEHYLSMVFPDVRLKRFIEIRIADSMDRKRAAEYCRIISGIFYNKKAVDEILERYNDVSLTDIAKAKLEIRKNGENAVVYGKSAKEGLLYIQNLAGRMDNEKY